MLREPRLKVFYSAPIQDLKLNFDVEEEEQRREYQRPWPDLQFLFSDDNEYNNLLEELHKYIEMEMNLVKQYTKVSGLVNNFVNSFELNWLINIQYMYVVRKYKFICMNLRNR